MIGLLRRMFDLYNFTVNIKTCENGICTFIIVKVVRQRPQLVIVATTGHCTCSNIHVILYNFTVDVLSSERDASDMIVVLVTFMRVLKKGRISSLS